MGGEGARNSGDGPSTRCFCLNRNRLVFLCVSTLFLFPQVGSRQELNKSFIPSISPALLIHPSSLDPTGTNLDLEPTQTSFMSQVGRYSGDSVQISFNNEDDETDRKIHKLLRQIVPLPPKKPSGSDSSEARMMAVYIDFISDFATYNGWSVVYILLPRGDRLELELELCEHLTTALARSKASLHAKCGTEVETIMANVMGKRDSPSSVTRLIMPIFSFYFLQNKNKTAYRGVPFHPKFLIHYSPTRPTFVLAGTQSKSIIIDLVQPEIQTSYKWTIISVPNHDNNTLVLEDVYGFTTGDPLTQIFGMWTSQKGLQIDTDKALGLSDFQGRSLRITSVAGPPVVFLHKSPDKLRASGYLPDIIEVISAQLNFTYELLTPEDNLFGNVVNETWSGMVGMLQRKTADIAMMSFSLTTSRKTVMDFSPPVEYSSVRLLIRRDWQNAELKWSAYLRPLDSKVWFTIPICVCLGVITLAIFSRFKVLEITPFSSAWLLSSCFVLQGQDEHSVIKVTPYRLVLGTFWVLSVFIFACYTARLTSFLAASNENLPIQSLSQAVKNRNWKVGLVKGSAFIDRIKESRVEVLRGLYQRIAEDSSALADSFQDGMSKVFKERYIFFTSELIPSFLIRGNCSYTWLPDKYFSGFGYMGYQKNLPFAPIISQRVIALRQSGQMQRMFKKWWGSESVCYTGSGDSFVGMSLYETGTAFLVLLLGLTMSITLFVGEVVTRNVVRHTEALANAQEGHDQGMQFNMGSTGTLQESQFSSNPVGYTYTNNFSF